MHTLFGITLVLYLLKLSVGQGFFKCPSDNYLSDSKRACPMDPSDPSDNLSLLTSASHES